MIRTALRRVLAGAVLSLAILGMAPAAAQATEPADDITAAQATVPYFVAAPPRPDDGGSYGDPGKYLTTNRWQVGSSNFHGRFDQFLQTDVISYSQRTITQSQGMAGANGLYVVTQGLLDFSLTLEPLNLLGAQADQIAATIGGALYKNSPVVVGLVVIIIAGVIFTMARSQQKPWKKLATTAGIVALFAVMVAGAGASTGGSDGTDYRPGLFSPGWIATKINDSVTTIATVPAQVLTLATPIEGAASPSDTGCFTYLQNLSTKYSERAGNRGAVPRIISSIWEASGLSVWKQTQYGSEPYNQTTDATYGDEVFCHQLDWQSGITPLEQANTTFGSIAAARAAGYEAKSAAWGADDNDQRDRSIIAWAACDNDGSGNFTVRGGFGTTAAGTPWIQHGDCERWWGEDAKKVNLDAFNVGGKSSDVTDKTEDPAIINFIQTLHGNDTNAGLILIWTFGISAFLLMLVFGGLGIAIIIAKFAGVVMIISVFFVLLMSLLARQDMGSKLMQFLKMYLGFTVFAFGATLILSMVTILSKMVSGTGNSVFGQGSIMALIWTGLSPIIACWLLHLIFTKMFKVPSVFKPSSALAWGAAGGAVGGVLGSAIARREGRASSIVKGMANQFGRKATNYALGGARSAGGSLARVGRRGMMAPGVGGTAVAGVAGGAAVAGAVVAGRGKKGLAGVGFDAKTLADAKTHARVTAPNAGKYAGASRLDRAAATGGQLTRKTLDKIAAGRAQARAMSTPAYRSELRARGAGAIGAAREKLSAAATQTRNVGQWLHDDPANAMGYLAESAGTSMRDAARTGGRAIATGARTGRKVLTSPAVRSVAKVGLGALVGTVLAGPVGTVAGAAVGAGRARATVTKAQSVRNAALVSNYLEHKQNTQPETRPGTPAPSVGEPARQAGVPERVAVSPAQ